MTYIASRYNMSYNSYCRSRGLESLFGRNHGDFDSAGVESVCNHALRNSRIPFAEPLPLHLDFDFHSLDASGGGCVPEGARAFRGTSLREKYSAIQTRHDVPRSCGDVPVARRRDNKKVDTHNAAKSANKECMRRHHMVLSMIIYFT